MSSPCLDNDYNTLGVLHSFQVAFLHKGGFFFLFLPKTYFNNVFPQSFSLLPPPPCSTGHSLSQSAPSTHLHMRPAYSFDVHHVQLLYKSKDYMSISFVQNCTSETEICTSVPYFLLQVSAFRPTQLRHSLRVKGRFSFKYVFVLTVTSR